MNKGIKHIELPEELDGIAGQIDPGTRFYKKFDFKENFADWFDAINRYASNGEGFLTPGTLALYANVSRAAVYKRIKEGRLTAFQFQVTEMYVDKNGQTTGRTVSKQTFCFIPMTECQQWAKRTGETALI